MATTTYVTVNLVHLVWCSACHGTRWRVRVRVGVRVRVRVRVAVTLHLQLWAGRPGLGVGAASRQCDAGADRSWAGHAQGAGHPHQTS